MQSFDAPCPNCGHLLWFASWGMVYISGADLPDRQTPQVTAGTLPEELSIAPEVLDRCTKQMATENCILPVELIGQTLVVAMHDPSNVAKVDEIRFRLNCDIRILHVDRQVLQRRVSAFYGTTT